MMAVDEQIYGSIKNPGLVGAAPDPSEKNKKCDKKIEKEHGITETSTKHRIRWWI